eukprot:GEMP01039865.1.p1 GENE.GEMP01039865.1~~GEMP01039865.1.p1  ORF type:complete len:463 (+),score=90.98 GEMP01039865.1:72-1391(+)
MADNGYIVVTLKKAFEIKRFFKGLPCEGMTDGYVRYPRQFQGPGEFIGFAIPPGTQICDDPFAQSQVPSSSNAPRMEIARVTVLTIPDKPFVTSAPPCHSTTDKHPASGSRAALAPPTQSAPLFDPSLIAEWYQDDKKVWELWREVAKGTWIKPVVEWEQIPSSDKLLPPRLVCKEWAERRDGAGGWVVRAWWEEDVASGCWKETKEPHTVTVTTSSMPVPGAILKVPAAILNVPAAILNVPGSSAPAPVASHHSTVEANPGVACGQDEYVARAASGRPQEDAPVLLQKLQGFWKDNHGQSFTVRIKGKDAVCRQGEKIHDLLLKDNRVYFGRWMRYFLISVDNEAGKARWQLAAGKDPIGHLGVAFEWLEDTDRSAQRNRMMMLESRKLKAVHLSNMQAAATDPNIREFLQGIKATAPAVQLSEHTQTVPQAWAQTGA